MPAALLTTKRSSSSKIISNLIFWGSVSTGSSSGIRTLMDCPSLTLAVGFLTILPSTSTYPSVISRVNRVRDKPAWAGASRESALSSLEGGLLEMEKLIMDKDDQPPNADFQLPRNLRFLQRLVTLLTVSMIAGILIIAALLAFKLRSENINFPQTLTLPDGTKPIAFTQTKDWYSIITETNEILIYKNDGTLIRSITVQDLE